MNSYTTGPQKIIFFKEFELFETEKWPKTYQNDIFWPRKVIHQSKVFVIAHWAVSSQPTKFEVNQSSERKFRIWPSYAYDMPRSRAQARPKGHLRAGSMLRHVTACYSVPKACLGKATTCQGHS